MYFTKLIEFEHIGFNPIFIFALCTIFFSIMEAWGFYNQNKVIWRKKKGDSISSSAFIFIAFMFLSMIIYGTKIFSGALIINGLLFFFCIPILIALLKFKGFKKKDWCVVFGCLFLIFMMIFFPFKEILFLFFMSGSIFALLDQSREIIKQKNSGIMEIKLIIVYLLSTVFWVIYSFLINDLFLKIICLLTLLTLILLYMVWFKYRFRKNIQVF